MYADIFCFLERHVCKEADYIERAQEQRSRVPCLLLTKFPYIIHELALLVYHIHIHTKIVVFVHSCIYSSCSPLLHQLFTRTAPGTVPEDQRTTRGQVSNLLQVPFLRGPAGRSTMMFRGSILWNALPSDFRVIGVPGPFQKALSAIDILTL